MTLKEHENTVYALAGEQSLLDSNVDLHTVNDKYLFSGGWDSKIKVWDLKTYECVATLAGHNNYISTLQVSGNFLYSGSWDNTVQVGAA